MDIEKRLRTSLRRVISECRMGLEDVEDDIRIVGDCVEKQIPLQPFKTTNWLAKLDLFECYNCDHVLDKTYNYCPHCGQRIEWDEDKWVK